MTAGHNRSSAGIPGTVQLPNKVISKVLLKAVSKRTGKKASAFKTFTLRNIDSSKVDTCSQLRALIREQLRADIIQGSFDVGYLQNTTVVSIRNEEDLAEIWTSLCKGKSIMLWCDGLKQPASETTSGRKRPRQPSPDSDLEGGSEEEDAVQTKRKKKEDQVTNTIADLKKRHGESYTTMQYRIWSEMKASGLHTSLADPPSTSMFARAGGNTGSSSGSKKSNSDTVSLVLNQLTSALKPPAASKSDSPGKVIENRSKCYRQLGELKNLWESGLISEDEYTHERECIMGTLKNLGGGGGQ